MPPKKRNRNGDRKGKNKKARSNKKCTNPSWEIVQTQPGMNMEDVFRSILKRIEPAEVYGCLKLLHNMHTSFGQIIANRGVISSFSGMVDISLIYNLNLLSYLKVNVKNLINVNGIENIDIHSLLWDASGKGLIGYYSENDNSAPVLCQIINPKIQKKNKEKIENGVNTGNDVIANFVHSKNQEFRDIYGNDEFNNMLRVVNQMEENFNNDIAEAKERVRKLTKKRIETIRRRYIESIRKELSDLGWRKKFALPKEYELTQADKDKILENIDNIDDGVWSFERIIDSARVAFGSVDSDDSTFNEDIESNIVDYIFSAKRDERRLYPIQAVKLTKDRIGSFLNSDIINVTEPEKFFLLPSYDGEFVINSNRLSDDIRNFSPNAFAYEIPMGYFGLLGDGAAMYSVESSAATGETKSAGETKSDITSTVQWRGFWQSIMRHNYKPLGSQDAQKHIESALYFDHETYSEYNIDWLTNPTPYCTIADKERLICGICGRPVGEKKWAEASTGGKGYDVDHVANLIFNELLELNARSDGLGFLNTCAKCNQAFKSEKIWSPSLELWNVLNEICKTKRYITDHYPWPGERNTGLTEEIPFGGVRVYTIVNTHNKAVEGEWKDRGIDMREVRKGEGYYSESARANVTAEMEPHELELVILDRYLKIAQTSEGQYMSNIENGFIKKYTEKVSIIASGASYIEYQNELTRLLQNEVIRAQQKYDMIPSKQAVNEANKLDREHPLGYFTTRIDLDDKSQASLDIYLAKRQLLTQSLQRMKGMPQDFFDGVTSAVADTGVPVPFDKVNVARMTRKTRMDFGKHIFNEWLEEKTRSRGRKSQEMIRNTIAERFVNEIDSTNLFLLLDEIKQSTKKLSNPSPGKPRSSEATASMDTASIDTADGAAAKSDEGGTPMRNDRNKDVANSLQIMQRILESIVMYKAMNNVTPSLIPQKYIRHKGQQAVMDILTGNISYRTNVGNEMIGARGTATSQNSFLKAKKPGTGSARRPLFGSNDQNSDAAADAAAVDAAADASRDSYDIGSLSEGESSDEVSSASGSKSPEPTAVLKTPSPKRRYGTGGGKGKTLKIRRRKKNTRRNRKNKNNKTKFKKRYKLKLTRRNK